MKIIIITLWFLASTPGTYSFGQPVTKERLEKNLDSIFATFKKNTPGIAITVIEKGKVITKKAFGMASIELNVPFTHQTVVRLPYSEGREFISIAAALMEKQGLLNLNNKVQQYFPELPRWSSTVTIQDLLNHSSGFADEWATLALTQASMTNRLDKSQFLQFLYNQPAPSIEPGKGYMYSNSDFGLLRLILEKASGEDLSNYLKRSVFEPLGMKNTRIHNDREEVIINQAFTYIIGANNTFKLWLQDKTSPGGNYFVLTSAIDLEKWSAAHADPSSFIFAAVQRLKQHARPIPVLPGVNYVFGHKEKKVGDYDVTVHMGVNENSYIAHVPEKKLTVIAWSNHLQPRWELMHRVLLTLLNLESKPVLPPDLTPEPMAMHQQGLDSIAGMYKWNMPLTFESYVPSKRFTTFIEDKGVLKVVYSGSDTFTLIQLAKNRFRDPEYPDVFVFSQTHPDSVRSVILYTYDGDTIRMEKLKDEMPKPKRQDLQLLTGKYYSPHLDFYLTLFLNDKDQLIVRRATISDKVLEPWPDGEFRLITDYGASSSESWIQFHKDQKGAVSHFTVSNPRLVDHCFEKIQ